MVDEIADLRLSSLYISTREIYNDWRIYQERNHSRRTRQPTTTGWLEITLGSGDIALSFSMASQKNPPEGHIACNVGQLSFTEPPGSSASRLPGGCSAVALRTAGLAKDGATSVEEIRLRSDTSARRVSFEGDITVGS